MKKLILASGLIAFLAVLGGVADAATTYTFASPGNSTWTCPAGVTSIQVECWGGGGGGGGVGAIDAEAGGGAGGSYVSYTLSVTPNTTYNLAVGAGGTAGQTTAGNVNGVTGGSSYFGNSISGNGSDATVLATGGAGGNGTTVAGTSGNRTGGIAGGTGSTSGNVPSSGATANIAGTSGGTSVGGASASATSGAGGAGAGPSGSAGGGAGGATAASGNNPGNPGTPPGGGGSGASSGGSVLNVGGAGGAGQVAITVATPFASTPGSLAVLQPANAGANNTAFSILELSNTVPNQAFAYTIPINGTNASGLRISGSAGTSGYLADSGDGTLLVFTGVNSTNTTTAVNAITNRGVGTLNAAGNYALPTTYLDPSAPTANAQPRGASTIDDASWVIGDQSGIYTNLSTSAAPAGNFKAVKSFGGTNYVLTASATVPAVMTVSGGTTNYLPGIPGDANATDFHLVSSGQNGAAFDVLYLIDNTATNAGTIYKYVLAGGSWTTEGTYSTGLGGYGLCAVTNGGGGGVNLYFTTGNGSTSGNSLDQVTDTTYPVNSTLGIPGGPGVVITLYTAPAGELLKGVAFVPVALAPSVSTQAANPTNTTSATLNGTVIYDGGAALTDYGFYWGTGSPITTSSNKVQVGTSDYSGAYSKSLTGLSVNTLYYYRAYASNSVGNTLGSSDVSFYTLANTPSAPTVGSPTTSSLNVAIGSGDGNPSTTTYAIKETITGNYVQSGGSLGASPVFQTASAWGAKTVTGLSPSTTYTFEVEAQNGAGINTSFGPTANGTTSTPPTPTISVTLDSLSFPPTLTNTTSANTNYAVSGQHLTANIVITAPANFQISTSSGSGFGGSVTLIPSGGTVASTTIYVRFQPTAQTVYSGNITHVSSGANNPNVAVSGIGAYAPSVSTQAANPTNTTSATLNGTVTATNGASIMDRGFYWSASPNVTPSATRLSEGGTTTGVYSKALTGLSVNTIYYFRAYASNSVGFTLDSADVSFYTLANTPTAPTVGSPTTNTLNVTIGSGDGNPAGTTYAIQETNSGNYVQANGTLSASLVYQTASSWGTKTVTGLNEGTAYAFAVKAQNTPGIATAFGPATTASTANGPFTPGNVAILSADVASANNSTFSIVELNPNTATAVQTVTINGTSGPNALRISGSAGTSAKLADSSDGTLLVFAGINTNNGTTTAKNVLPRAVGTLDASNNFTFQTTYIGISGNQVRNAATVDNKTWYVGDQGGIYTNGGTAPLNTGNISAVKSFGSIIYSLRASPSKVPVSMVSADGTTLTDLPGLPAGDNAAVDFYMLASGNNGTTYDILYILDETTATAGVVNKYSLVNGTWTLNGTYDTSFGGVGLAAALTGNYGANLYITTGDGTVADNSIYQLTDAAGWNAAPNVTAQNLLYTATGTATLKGVAFAPVNPLMVTNTANSGPGTLRYNITNAWSGAVIRFAPNLSGSNILLASTLTINTNLTIDASALPSGININGNHSVDIFNVDSGNNVVLNSLTITNGSAGLGGGIYNGGTLTVNQSTLSGNNANGGGGVYNGGVLTVNQSTLSGNTASSFSLGGGINNGGTLTVNQSTLSGNTANGGGAGGGIYNTGTLTFLNSIVAGNAGASDIDNESSETIAGTNVVKTLVDNGTTVNNGSIISAVPLLAALGNYGGPTQTMPPLSGSPAIDAGSDSATDTFATDQRGLPRLSGQHVDIGAVEVQIGTPPVLNGSVRSGGAFQFGFTDINYGGFTVFASTNVALPFAQWSNLGVVTENPLGSGQYQFSDPDAANHAQRFYRVTSP